jgi:hypothetical protein
VFSIAALNSYELQGKIADSPSSMSCFPQAEMLAGKKAQKAVFDRLTFSPTRTPDRLDTP